MSLMEVLVLAALPWAYLDCPADQLLPRNLAPKASWCVRVNEAREHFTGGDAAKAYLVLRDADAHSAAGTAGALELPLAEAACTEGARFVGQNHYRLAQCLFTYPEGSLAGLDTEAAREAVGWKRIPDEDCVALRRLPHEGRRRLSMSPTALTETELARIAGLCSAKDRAYLPLEELQPYMADQ